MHERPRHYPSDTSDEQWAIIEPLLPPVKAGGRPEKHSRRAIVDAILYVVRAGCAWRALPVAFPPWQTVYWYFNQWERAKVTEKILPVVRTQLRVQEGRNPEPSAGLIDSQSVRGDSMIGMTERLLRGRPRQRLPPTWQVAVIQHQEPHAPRVVDVGQAVASGEPPLTCTPRPPNFSDRLIN